MVLWHKIGGAQHRPDCARLLSDKADCTCGWFDRDVALSELHSAIDLTKWRMPPWLELFEESTTLMEATLIQCIATLSSHPNYQDMSAEEIYQLQVKLARESSGLNSVKDE